MRRRRYHDVAEIGKLICCYTAVGAWLFAWFFGALSYFLSLLQALLER